jgi:hypothetical protein
MLLGTIVLSALPARAQSAPAQKTKKARELFKKGRQSYRLHDFTEALKHFKAALSYADRASIYLNIGQCHRQLNHTNEALFYYKVYLTKWQQQNPGKPSPYEAEIKKHIKALEASASRATRATLILKSTPSNARIIFDGRELAMKTPATLRDLSPGKHSIELRAGGLYHRGVVTLEANRQSEIQVQLRVVRASVLLVSVPEGAVIRRGDTVLGTTPKRVTLGLGQHTFDIRKKGYVPVKRLVKVDSPNNLKVDVVLVQQAKLLIKSQPSRSTVYVDGQAVGATPVELYVAPGKHQLALTAPGRKRIERDIAVKAGQTLESAFSLKLFEHVARRIKVRRRMRIAGWTTLSIGVVGGLVASGLTVAGIMGGRENDKAYHELTVQSKIDDAYEKGSVNSLLTSGIIVGSLSAACLVTASLLFILQPKESLLAESARSIRVGLSPSGVTIGGVF